MQPARLRARTWVDACLTVCRSHGIPATVLARGDADAGTVLLKWRPPGGEGAVLSPFTGLDGERLWTKVTGADPVAEAECDAYWRRQRERDRDLWVVEIESRELWHPLGETVEDERPAERNPAAALFRWR
ncbi:MAG TPA: DUF1491 family protein [Alphaproteobacteria bacterium]|nr:DUF1491 family protein [Alphaproteobacteria bacterium]